MHLRSITLRGFKSFPDRTKLDFAPGISVVVGPNGSGKSNITDAVLWAMGEQSPLAVRGQSMQDVIFAGARGVQARQQAEVEVVIDNADGAIDLPLSEISILRRLDRAGEGEYRLNGARCRLTDVLEVLSDTGLGKEMHSVVSQGRVEAIVTSKPRDRRLLIEEAAGLGKHRKRRRRAQLKLDRTQENLDRALDVEREARSRLRPLKRQAEAAELHARLERQADEARWTLATEALRAARTELAEALERARTAREQRDEVSAGLAAVARRRELAEQALSTRGDQRERVASAFFAARSAADKLTSRLEAARIVVADLEARVPTRRERVLSWEDELAGEREDDGGSRIATLEAELARVAEAAAERRRRELEILEQELAMAAKRTAHACEVADARLADRMSADKAADAARAARRQADRAVDAARREAARIGAELAQVNHLLRTLAPANGTTPTLADRLDVRPGAELAVAAALGQRLSAALVDSRADATRVLDRAGADGGVVLVSAATEAGPDAPDVVSQESAAASSGTASASKGLEGWIPLREVLHASDPDANRHLGELLEDAWLVPDIAAIPEDFDGLAVTGSGRVWDGGARELRQVAAGGADRILAERNRRDALIAETEVAAQAEIAARAAVDEQVRAFTAAETARDEADRTARDAARARQEAEDAERLARRRLDERRRAGDDGPAAAERARLQAEISAEHKMAERLAAERRARRERLDRERAALAAEEQLLPQARDVADALASATASVALRVEALAAAREQDRSEDERLSAELRACARDEAEAQRALAARADAVTSAEVAVQRGRDRWADADRELRSLSERLGLTAEPADEPMAEGEEAALRARIDKLDRRRSQLGPVNPLAKEELDAAVAHVEELEAQREDLEAALRELRQLVRETDIRIREAFEETFTAAARNFEEVAQQLFPGGRGRLRLVREDAGPRPVLGGADAGVADTGSVATPEDRAEAVADAEAEAGFRAREGEAGPGEDLGVEIEITPAGKATKRLSLLSGGEKSMTALAFLFAVFLARPCPFYILDEVEAALDDLNIDRFLNVLRRYADRAQFIVVTHQKRTMEAADCLYGVSMAGNGVSKVVSRRLPKADTDVGVGVGGEAIDGGVGTGDASDGAGSVDAGGTGVRPAVSAA